MEIPAEFSGLTKLSILNVVGNQLQYLPYTFTTLKSITAIWIAENQSRPILDLQLLRGEDGEKYLTCFLFPQQGHERPYEEGMCTGKKVWSMVLILILVFVSTYTNVLYGDDLYQLACCLNVHNSILHHRRILECNTVILNIFVVIVQSAML